MQPRIRHLARAQATEYQQEEPAQVPQRQQESSPSNVLPRNIVPSMDQIPLHQRFALKNNSLSFPPADTLFACHNHYDAGPTFLRVTSGCLGVSKSTFPTSAWIVPLGHDSAEVASVRVKAPLRCVRCKAYVNPYFKIDASSSVVTCNLCGHRFACADKIDPAILNSNEIYTQGIMDFKVSDTLYIKREYDCVNILIALEMTKTTIQKAIFSSVLEGVKSVVANHQFDSGVRIGIVTYNQVCTFYKIKTAESQVSEYIVSDQTDAMCPLSQKQLFYNPNDEAEKGRLLALIDRLLEKSQIFSNQNVSTNYYSLVSCLSTAFGKHSGRICLFSLNDPSSAPGKLRPREKEEIKTPLKPLHNEYRELAKQLVQNRIGLDHFIFGKEGYVQHEMATIQYLSLATGGSINHYLLFNPQINGDHLYFTIYKSLTRECAYDVNFTCRVSNGLTVTSYVIGDGIHSDSRDISLGILDSSQSVSVNFQHEQKQDSMKKRFTNLTFNLYRLTQGAYLQFAMMFTNTRGERIIRVINYKFSVSDKLQQVHQGADYLAVANFITKKFVNELPKTDSLKVLEDMITFIVNMLHQYKADRGEAKFSELQIHANLKLMLPYLHAVVTTPLFTSQIRNIPDSRILEINKINSLTFQNFANRYYPKIYPIDYSIYQANLPPGDFMGDSDIAIIPPNIPLSNSALNQESMYLACDSQFIYLIIFSKTNPELLRDIFGVQNYDEITELNNIPYFEQSSHSVRVNNIIGELRRRNHTLYLPLLVLNPGQTKSILDHRLTELLKEDNRERPFLAFLQTIHARVNSK